MAFRQIDRPTQPSRRRNGKNWEHRPTTKLLISTWNDKFRRAGNWLLKQFSGLLEHGFSNQFAGTRPSAFSRLVVESLEARFLLSTFHWQGDVSNQWSNPDNWLEGLAPTNGSSLVFSDSTPGYTGNYATVNDLVGLELQSIEFAGGTFGVNGSSIAPGRGRQFHHPQHGV